MHDHDEEDKAGKGGLIGAIKVTVLRPIQPFLSHRALRTYVTTCLLLFTASVLLGCAIAAYVLFYWSYIPRIGFERTIHLQFDHVFKTHAATKRTEYPYPYGSASLAPDLVGLQGYDIAVELDMPRSHDNQEAGNFMLEVAMYAQEEGSINERTLQNGIRLESTPTRDSEEASNILAFSRRHAIVPHRSWIVDCMHTLMNLPWYFFDLRSETEKLWVPIFEKVSFAKGRKSLPASLHLEVQSTHRLQIYRVVAHFRARFTGLRWVMYNHRLVSAFIFTLAFWLTELLFFGLAWAVVSFYISSPSKDVVKAEPNHESLTIKREEDDDIKSAMSDTERTFPTLAGQPHLRYSGSGSGLHRVKQEEEEELSVCLPITPAAEADDEDEDVDFFDSGIGTSLESSNPTRRDSIRKRRGRVVDRPDADDRAY